MKMKSLLYSAVVLSGATLALALPPTGRGKEPGTKEQVAIDAQHQARVQLAILLDTSGSMDGLIEQAKTQLWSIVNTFINARQGGKAPFVRSRSMSMGTKV